jgi:hypothetical protein
MLDWLTANVEWVFSGIGVTIVVSIFTVIVGIPTALFHRRRRRIQNEKPSTGVSLENQVSDQIIITDVESSGDGVSASNIRSKTFVVDGVKSGKRGCFFFF